MLKKVKKLLGIDTGRNLALKLIKENKRTQNPYLDLGNCGLTDDNFPNKELGELGHLETLILAGGWYDWQKDEWENSQNEREENQLGQLPSSLGQLSNLKKLVVEGIYSEEVRQNYDLAPLAGLNQLNYLFLQNIQVSDLAPLAGLNQLNYLDLNNTQVSDLSPLAALKQLKTLNLNNIQVSDLNPLAGLTQLNSLNLNNIQVSDLNPLAGLTQLNSLDLRNTQVSDLNPLAGLTQLNSLELRNTQVSDLNPLAGLTQLNSLDLTNTQVSDLNPLAGLTQLNSLDLTNTQVRDIEPLLPIIKNGIVVTFDSFAPKGIRLSFLSGTPPPLTHPPLEIAHQGNEAILNYFAELEEGDETVYEAKLLIIGEAGVGKTTFARKLKDLDAAMPVDKDTTKGIQVEPLVIETPGLPDFTMHVWDFGGQEIYHSTHQFFLSKRSLYVLLLDGRIEEDPHYWLQVQDLYGEDSPLLLLLNKKGEIRSKVAFQELVGMYKNLRKPLNTFSLKADKAAVAQFVETVKQQIRTLPHFQQGEKVPRKWARIRTRLEEEAKACNYISLETYRKICTEEGIDTHKRQDFLSDFLHSLGAILHFSKEPLLRKMLILNPAWATEAVYKVLDHTKEQAQVAGHFHRTELDQIWQGNQYVDVFDELLRLMELFELCYPLPHQPDEFIVPALLSPDKPVYDWEEKDQLQLRYKYDFMPKGIVTRLIVRLHRYIADQATVWQRGAIFGYPNATADVTERYRDKEIRIKVKGANRKAMMTIIAKEIDEINSTFDFDEDLSVSKLIPCNCERCNKANADQLEYYDWKTLLEFKADRVPNIQCRKSRKMASVIGLLEDVFVSQQPTLSHTFTPKSPQMIRSEYLRQLLMDNKLGAALKEMARVAQGTDADNMAIQLNGQYNGLKREIQARTISFENQQLSSNKLLSAAQALLKDLQRDMPARMQEAVTAQVHDPDPVLEARPPQAEMGRAEYHFHGNVGSVNPHNQGHITQHIDQSSTIHEQIPPFQQMVEAEKQAGFITQDEYDELMDILAEIKEEQQPTARQKGRWKRWIGKAVEASGKFVGKRIEKGADTLVSEEVKQWIAENGPAKFLEMIA